MENSPNFSFFINGSISFKAKGSFHMDVVLKKAGALLGKTFALTLFEPNHAQLRDNNEKGFCLLLKNPSASVKNFKKPLPQNSFLVGCLDYTEKEKIEHLNIGFEYKRECGTQVHFLQHLIGPEHSVPFLENIKLQIEHYLSRIVKAEVSTFHNHHQNFLNDLIDYFPVASTEDREIVKEWLYLTWFPFFRKFIDNGTLSFYLGENTFLDNKA